MVKLNAYFSVNDKAGFSNANALRIAVFSIIIRCRCEGEFTAH